MQKKQYIISKLVDNKEVFTFGAKDDFAFVKAEDSNLSRILTHTQKGYFIISASRNTNTEEENVRLTKELEKDIRAEGLGFISSLGGYVEDKEIPVEELSFIVPYKEEYGDYKKFVDLALRLCDKYNQEDVLVQVPTLNGGKAVYLDRGANVDMVFESFGLKQPNEPYYTRLKKGSHSDKPFVFRDNEDVLKQYSQFRRVYLTKSGKESHKNDLDMKD